jgi:predicted amidohydrolase
MKSLRIAVAQFNAIVGDIAGNASRILDLAHRARELRADVMLTPELALCGYPPEDLLMRPDFYRACAEQLSRVAKQTPLPVVVGYPEESGDRRYNAAALLEGGELRANTASIACRTTRSSTKSAISRRAASPAWSRSTACAAGWQSVPTSGNTEPPKPRRWRAPN